MAGYEIVEFTAPEKVNPYTEPITALAKTANEKAAIVFEVDVKDVKREQLKIQKAANAIGKTARLRLTDESGVKEGKPDEEGNPTQTGIVKLTFTLSEKHKARRTKAAE